MTRTLEFTKMHGAGNDFVVLDGLSQELPALDRLARRLADRRFGVGADQILVVRPSRTADFRMDIWNADGSRAEMCANGIRAFYEYVRQRGLSDADEITVETLGGVVRPRRAGEGRVRVEMGRPVLEPAKIPTTLRGDRRAAADRAEAPLLDASLDVDGEVVRVGCVSMGNPHAVLFVPDVDAAPVERLGPRIEHHPAFPNRVNVEFVEVVARDRVRQRTWERGVGETLACGSGACAVAVVCVLGGRTERRLCVALRGGELEITWERDDAPVVMTGPAARVFNGRIEIDGD
jgi:diaminopimelate epimerase